MSAIVTEGRSETPPAAENSAESGKLSYDLRAAIKPRRYVYIERDGIRLRLQSWTAKEFRAVSSFPAQQQTDIGFTYAIVDENGDCTHTHDMEGASYFQDIDAETYAWLAEEVNRHCLGESR